jgi:hypothetical protein
MRHRFYHFFVIAVLAALPNKEGYCKQDIPSSPQNRDQEVARLIDRFRPRIIDGGFYADETQSAEPERELIEIASASPEARTAVINALIDTLNEPGLRINYDGYHSLSSGVCRVLGKLKAVESIDVLVTHLSESSMRGGYSYTPFVWALVQIGEPAVSKIQERLSSEGKCGRACRINAIDALAGIRGDDMREQFETRLLTERDRYVRNVLMRYLNRWNLSLK